MNDVARPRHDDRHAGQALRLYLMTALCWRNQPAFISSTFRDMPLERDHLWRFVFHWLGEFPAQRRMHLEPIELRWSVIRASFPTLFPRTGSAKS